MGNSKSQHSTTTQLKYACLALFALAVVLLVYLAMTRVGTTGSAAGATPRPIPSATAAVAPVTFAAVGDSVTAGNSPAFSEGRLGDLSWADHVPSASTTFVGGWAVGGSTTAAMVDNVTAYDSDVLVIMAGTNDSGLGIPFNTSAANYDKIVATAGADRVIVSSIPPRDEQPDLATSYNTQLEQLATVRGWTFVDAAAALRDGDKYAAGMTADGIHPTAEGATKLGSALTAAITG